MTKQRVFSNIRQSRLVALTMGAFDFKQEALGKADRISEKNARFVTKVLIVFVKTRLHRNALRSVDV